MIPEDEPDGIAFNPIGESNDIITNPSHYNRNGIESIDVLRAYLTPEEFKGYLKGTQLTYLLRAPWKKQEKSDILKSGVYSKWLVDEVK
jgi:Protein of unknwon function (DUF3310)